MKIEPRQVETFIKSPNPNICCFLVYGPDPSIVKERAITLCRHSGLKPDDPFGITTCSGEDLARNISGLFDEASALTFGGGARVIRVQGASDSLTEGVNYAFQRGLNNVMVVIETGELSTRSRLRRLFESTEHGASIPCYEDTPATREKMIKDIIETEGFIIESKVVKFLSFQLSGDRGLARMELEKLLLYCGNQTSPITMEEVSACVRDDRDHALEDIALAAGGGRTSELFFSYKRCLAAGETEIAILRAVSRHFQRLLTVSLKHENGTPIKDGLKLLRPPVFFKVRSLFIGQVSLWTSNRLRYAINLILNAERLCKTTGMPPSAICERTLFQISAVANNLK